MQIINIHRDLGARINAPLSNFFVARIKGIYDKEYLVLDNNEFMYMLIPLQSCLDTYKVKNKFAIINKQVFFEFNVAVDFGIHYVKSKQLFNDLEFNRIVKYDKIRRDSIVSTSLSYYRINSNRFNLFKLSKNNYSKTIFSFKNKKTLFFTRNIFWKIRKLMKSKNFVADEYFSKFSKRFGQLRKVTYGLRVRFFNATLNPKLKRKLLEFLYLDENLKTYLFNILYHKRLCKKKSILYFDYELLLQARILLLNSYFFRDKISKTFFMLPFIGSKVCSLINKQNNLLQNKSKNVGKKKLYTF